MAKRRKIGYTYRFYKGKKRIALGKLRYATTFEIWYGSRRLVAPKPFTKSQKKLEARRNYLRLLTKRIEIGRLEAIEAKKKAKIKKYKAEIAKLKKIKTRETRKASKKPQKPGNIKVEERELYNVEIDQAHIGLPIFNKVFGEPSPTFLNVECKDTLIIPIEPDSHRYNKRLIEKAMWSSKQGHYDLSILDLTMIAEEYFTMEADTFAESYKAAFLTFTPHIMNYFENVKSSSDLFTLRIKFLWQGDKRTESSFSTHGLSLNRMQLRTRNGMLELIRDTFIRFFGPQNMDIRRGVHGKRNYLVGERVVLITGFTLEAMAYE